MEITAIYKIRQPRITPRRSRDDMLPAWLFWGVVYVPPVVIFAVGYLMLAG